MSNNSDYGWAAKIAGAFIAVGIGAGVLLWVVGLLWPVLGPVWGFIIWLWDPLVWVVGFGLLYIVAAALKNDLSQMDPNERKSAIYGLGYIVAVVLLAYTIGLSGGGGEATAENAATPADTTEIPGTVDADNYDENEEDDDDSGVYVGDGRDSGGDYDDGDSGGDYDGGDGIDIGDGNVDGIPGI